MGVRRALIPRVQRGRADAVGAPGSPSATGSRLNSHDVLQPRAVAARFGGNTWCTTSRTTDRRQVLLHGRNRPRVHHVRNRPAGPRFRGPRRTPGAAPRPPAPRPRLPRSARPRPAARTPPLERRRWHQDFADPDLCPFSDERLDALVVVPQGARQRESFATASFALPNRTSIRSRRAELGYNYRQAGVRRVPAEPGGGADGAAARAA